MYDDCRQNTIMINQNEEPKDRGRKLVIKLEETVRKERKDRKERKNLRISYFNSNI